MPRKGSGPAPVERRCEHCGAPFWHVPKTSIAGRNWGRYCGHACANAALAVPLRTRFEARVTNDGPIPPHVPELGNCYEWTGAFFSTGYGRLGRNRRPGAPTATTTELAHRISWELHYGPIPAGLDVCHACDNRRCVRPEHLFLGTARDNRLDAVAKGRAYIPTAPIGQDHGRTKLTDEDVRAIRRAADAGISPGYLSLRYGVDKATIHRIRRRETWQHLD